VIRHCDGTDPNLLGEDRAPCACGLTFDGVDHVVIWPHQRIPSREERAALLAAYSGDRGRHYETDQMHAPTGSVIGRLATPEGLPGAPSPSAYWP